MAKAPTLPGERRTRICAAAISSRFRTGRGGRWGLRDMAGAGHWPRSSWSGRLQAACETGEQFGVRTGGGEGDAHACGGLGGAGGGLYEAQGPGGELGGGGGVRSGGWGRQRR